MTTEKQAAANKANSKKSTGPRTPAGKAVVAGNAISHGILSKRLFLEDENPAEFEALQDDLRQALRPMGALELSLVEKVAVAIWKQRRMVAAETAMLELGRSLRRQSVREEVKEAAGMGYTDADITDADVAPLTEDEQEQRQWCLEAIEQAELVSDEALSGGDLEALAEVAPLLYEQLRDEAGDVSPVEYLAAEYSGGLAEWFYELLDYCSKTMRDLNRRPVVQAVAKLVQAQKAAPLGHEVLMRYQSSLDGELYRAIDALRKQQAFRLKLGAEIDGEAVC